jgi:hypothetical protein
MKDLRELLETGSLIDADICEECRLKLWCTLHDVRGIS